MREAAARFLRGGEASGAALALFNLAAVMDERGPTYALPVNVEAIELAERLGTDAYVWLGRASRLRTLARLGRFDEVLDEANPVLDWVAEHDDAFSRLLVLTGLATVEIERGERLVDPAELADLCRRMANEETLIVAARLALARAEVDLARDFVLEGSPNVRLGDAYGFARLCVEAGLSELATDLLSRKVARHPREEGSTLGATAILAEAKGKHAAARTDYAEATETFRTLQMAPDLGTRPPGAGTLPPRARRERSRRGKSPSGASTLGADEGEATDRRDRHTARDDPRMKRGLSVTVACPGGRAPPSGERRRGPSPRRHANLRPARADRRCVRWPR